LTIDKFHYLSDVLEADGGFHSAVTEVICSAWKKFYEYLLTLNADGFP